MKHTAEKPLRIPEKLLRSLLLSGCAMQSCIERKDLSSGDVHVTAWERAHAAVVAEIERQKK